MDKTIFLSTFRENVKINTIYSFKRLLSEIPLVLTDGMNDGE